MATIGFSQKIKPTYKVEGDLVKATYYYDNGDIKTQGFFKDSKLSGEWTKYNKEGVKVGLAYYKEGKKVGKWFIWSKDYLKEINYVDNSIASVNTWKTDSKMALNN
ncbi:nicotinic acid mononucleotide adenyltransferase [Polaribacter reichenbachii]|nr:nicotinic acid mononucleotide adenyltransferase [Polaribacter reichenbachii]